MDTGVIAGISHKGGTGRSVTLANIAYHLHFSERSNVCLVDLDLASPTMGAILDLEGLEFGVPTIGARGRPKSVHDLLAFHDDPMRAVIDLRSHSPVLQGHVRADKQFGFIPGAASGGDWSQQLRALRVALRNLIEQLRSSTFDFILLDIRSGLSDVLEALKHEATDLVDLLLVHTRWTPQHLLGLESLLQAERVKAFGEAKVKIIRTAFIDPMREPASLQDFANDVDQELGRRFHEIEWFGKPLSLKRKSTFLGSVPLDPRLRWKEQVIVQENGPSQETYETYRRLACEIAAEMKN